MSGELSRERLLELKQRLSSRRIRFNAATHCFDAQRPFATSRAKWVTASCSRRSGKTEGGACLALDAMQETPGGVVLYITDSRVNAKRIFWNTLKRVAREVDIGAVPHEGELHLNLPNGSVCYLLGIHDKDAIDKVRGLPICLVILDEAQILKNLQPLIEDVLEPALMDFDGRVVLSGTPAPVPNGYFWDCINNDEWAHYSWTVFDNPHIKRKSGKTPQEHLDATLKRRGVTIEDPSIQREWFGRWVYDPNALVFRYDAARNDYNAMPPVRGDLECVVSGDLGWDDADALAVLAWDTAQPNLYLIREDVMPKQTISELGDKLKALVDQHKPLATVLDFGGLGKKIAEELTKRWGLNVQAAEKERKLEHIELLNDALRTGRLFAKKDSQFAKDSMLVEWDRTNPERPKISDRFHSDICFVAGTLVQTESGPRPVEQLRAGDRVWTRKGLRPVLAAAQTQSAPIWELRAGSAVLRGTAGHPVWTNTGWRQLRDLTQDDTLTGWAFPSSLTTKARGTTDHCATEPGGNGSIGSSGRSTTAHYQGIGRFITSMATRSTMRLRTLWACLGQITLDCTARILALPRGLLRTGIAHRLAASGIGSMVEEQWLAGNTSGDAWSVERHSLARCRTLIGAATNVEPRRGEIVGSMTSSSPALSVERSSCAIGTGAPNTVPIHAPHARPTGDVLPVYNLTVEGEHEYFANGILVSNCDAVLYGYRRAYHWLWKPEDPPPPRPGSLEALAAMDKASQSDIAAHWERKREELEQRREEREELEGDMREFL